ncbi:MAG: glycine--tRNA ligase subunit beta [Elainellaceae cyanobacterium]
MATFLLEVGTEELPAGFLDQAFAQWRSRIPASLAEAFLNPEAINIYGTPRRLVLLLEGLPERQPDRTEEVKGPPAQAAFKGGKPTKAAEGFARSRGAAVEDLEVRDTGKGSFVYVTQRIEGRSAADVLREQIPEWVLGLEGKRFMRWGDGDLRFPRPIRWLIPLLDDQLLPITLENGSEVIESDRTSYGHRVLSPGAIEIAHAADYLDALRAAHIEVDPEQRRTAIAAQTQEAAQSVGGVARVAPELLQEVVNLVETPTAVVGSFAAEFLELPAEVIVTEMESHQRYFPVMADGEAGELLPYFITISNGDPNKAKVIAAGNERVIRARLSDGKFFFDLDRKQTLEAFLPQLEAVTFQQDIGSVRQKATRIEAIAGLIMAQLDIEAPQKTHVQRGALLCKADLVTQMVGEFPELQGVMGQKYALTSGEDEAVATAIFEHYLPRGADDIMPQTLAGQVVGLADRLDTLISIFSLGMVPSGSSDPIALRRAANAVVSIIWAGSLDLDLRQLLEDAIARFPQHSAIKAGDAASLQAQLASFFQQRLQSLLGEMGIDYDLINAVLGEGDPEYAERALSDLLDVRDRAQFLQQIRVDGTLEGIYETVNRASRLAAQSDFDTAQLDPAEVIDTSLFQQDSEQAFYDALVTLVPKTQQAQASRDYGALVGALGEIAPVVSQFFDGPDSVLVMAEDPAVRRNRLTLLGLLRNHARVLADFGAIVKQ